MNKSVLLWLKQANPDSWSGGKWDWSPRFLPKQDQEPNKE